MANAGRQLSGPLLLHLLLLAAAASAAPAPGSPTDIARKFGAVFNHMFSQPVKSVVATKDAAASELTIDDGVETVSAKTGSQTGLETGGDGQQSAEKSDQPDSKIFDSTNNSRIFFNYGAALVALIYGLMGVGYFYGPYSIDAELAKKRTNSRIDFLKVKLNQTEEQLQAQKEFDYGYFINEEVQSFDDYGYNDQSYGHSDPLFHQQSQSSYVSQQPSYQAARSDDVTQPEYQLVVTSDGQQPLVLDSQLTSRRGQGAETETEHIDTTGLTVHGIDVNQLVKVLDMEHAECQAWIRCLEERRRSQQQQQQQQQQQHSDTWQPVTSPRNCERFYSTCPALPRPLMEIVQPTASP